MTGKKRRGVSDCIEHKTINQEAMQRPKCMKLTLEVVMRIGEIIT